MNGGWNVYYLGFFVVAAVIAAIWLIKHPLVLLTLNAVPLAWWQFGTAGLMATLALTSMVAATHRIDA